MVNADMKYFNLFITFYFIFFCPACTTTLPSPEHAVPAATLYFMPVGQGSATLLQCPDQKNQILIDGGSKSDLYPGGTELLRKSLRKLMGSDRTVEHVVITHPHPDHFTGLSELMKNDSDWKIKNLYQPAKELVGSPPESLPAEDHTYNLRSDMSFSFCTDTVPIVVELWVPEKNRARELNCPADLNNCGIVVRINTRHSSALIAADSTFAREEILIKGRSDSLNSKLLLAGHHAHTSSSPAFLNTVSPDFIVISTGAPGIANTERYGYPRCATLDQISSFLNTNNSLSAAEDLECCTMLPSGCNWEKRPVPPSVFSTVNPNCCEFTLTDLEIAPKE